MSEPMPKIIIEHKYTSDLTLTPEQMQAQQDAYDQMQAPTTEPVDFAADREAYLSARQIRNAILSEDGDGNIVVQGEIDINPSEYPEGSFGFTEPKLF